ncbi:type II toxin-antitoxin system RelE/ParE family toxin [Pseudomonas lijiangensis]|uniref:Type II toxin-antitoxin system RelE/ParE family toxin n=1 Tax=Pseudomonas lijiangensis TaxID=2995658 RepID=A0ABX8HMY3_9PSED|nr:type II toxin-antitoxin system RelE/ParE family toxin [Pseudomonas lijiangensis]MBX8500003.1 type II toxin-antitoxin system RelE/ParE family toxin [Pseudomonas lijiangensis]MBX8503760.1 type II toxin-antitoxin system RelE/ParE family toxin [Pseudomonas lijiangensis]QWU81842.1 type II toxin-antitoxin system RelE/ParE family toxin [Pseudomonas lijiangensis]
MPQIELSEKADSDLDAIHGYYAALIGDLRADTVISEIFASIEQLEAFPGMGRPAQNPDVRELVLNRYPFVVSYIVKQDIVFIARILHERNERFSC